MATQVSTALGGAGLPELANRLERTRTRHLLGVFLVVSILNYIDRQIMNILAELNKQVLRLADWQLGSAFTSIQSIVRPGSRATASAISISKLTIIGLGWGAKLIALACDFFARVMYNAEGLRWGAAAYRAGELGGCGSLLARVPYYRFRTSATFILTGRLICH